ncbi:MAG: hypothetical protein U5K51_00250 [Flavobacteriaceae bacterium]|nr:hypothetical protein [Flavobacteriaceae bacterium]
MTIADLYHNEERIRNLADLANLYRVAKSDGAITPEEMLFLRKIAKRYDIDEEEFKKILKSPDDFPTIGYYEFEDRVERFYDMMKMISDHNRKSYQEVRVLKKVVTGLSFCVKKVDNIVDAASKIDFQNCEFEEFKEKIFAVCH